jgi:hypothetical protein
MFRLAVGPTQPPIQWVLALSPGVKRLGHEADHSPPPSAIVMNAWSYTSTPSISLWHGTGTTLPLTLHLIRIP